MTNYKNQIQVIDSVSIKAVAAKGLGRDAQKVKDQVTSTIQWLVADMVWNKDQLSSFLSEWSQQSDLVGEQRRTAKSSLINAVHQWSENAVQVEINERTTGNKLKGVHVHYPDQYEQDRASYQASVKAMKSAITKHGITALYDAMAMLEMERQESKNTPSESVDTKKLGKILEGIKAEDQAAKIREEKNAILQSIM